MSSIANLYNKITLNPPSTGQLNTIAPKTYRGFSTVSADTENYGLFDFQLIQQDLMNHFHIRQGERLMNPSFGTVIWDMLFEPLTNEVKTLITNNVDQILNYDPRISAQTIIVTPYDMGIQIECVLTYLPYNISQTLQLKFDQANGFLAQ